MKQQQKAVEHYLIPLTLASVIICLLNLLWLLHVSAAPGTTLPRISLLVLALILLLLSLKYRNFYLVVLADVFFLLVFFCS